MLRLTAPLGCALFGLIFTGATKPPGFVTGSCASDIERVCKNEKSGEGQVLQCLYENESRLSPGCRSDIEQLRPDLEAERKRINRKIAADKDELHDVCGSAIKAYCPGRLDGYQLMACLTRHKDKLTNKCNSLREDLRQNIGGY